MKEQKLTKEQLHDLKEIKVLNRLWYLSASEYIYEEYEGVRLSDAQLAKLLVKKYGGTEAGHTAKIRQTRCNDKSQPYVSKNL